MACAMCAGDDALTHTTEEHDENWVAKQEHCEDCGAEEGEDCKPDCLWAYCPICGLQVEEHPDSKPCEEQEHNA